MALVQAKLNQVEGMKMEIDKVDANYLYYLLLYLYRPPDFHCFYLTQDNHSLPLHFPVHDHIFHKTWHLGVYWNHKIHNDSYESPPDRR
jgi:hypothetical protein